MNKKFTSAILFGALLAASASTFVSCKDYDDDIDAINEELAQVKSRVSAIEAEIEKGEWITSVVSVSNGFTVTFSNGQSYTITNGKDGANGTNGKDGADGANGIDGKNGTNGTVWTISEDGYWVCDDVKTTVKAVGVDGTKAQQEVKKENGTWYLWNGTEYEALSSDFDRAEAIPYYYIDPNDQNYAVLVVSDVNGSNKEEIRLPLNEGLAQLNFLEDLSELTVWYTVAAKDIKWEGPKGNVAKGSYLMTQDAGSVLVQVTPSNYDLAAIKDFSMVNSLNEVAPIKVGTPVAYNKLLTTKGVSENGLFELPIEATSLNEELVKLYKGNNVLLSLKANDKVRSGYNYTFTLKASSDIQDSELDYIEFGKADAKATKSGKGYITAEAGDSILFEATEGAEYVYDAYLTTAEMSEQDKVNYEAWGITIDKKAMKIESNDKANGTLDFKIVCLDVKGERHEYEFTVDFTKTNITRYNKLFDKAIEHKVSASEKDYFMVIDLSNYFKGMSTEDRAYWNTNAQAALDSIVWTGSDGKVKTIKGKDLTGSCGFTVAKDIEDDAKKELEKELELEIEDNDVAFEFEENYGALDFDTPITAYISFKDGTNRGSVDIIEIPFKLVGPTADDIKKLYSYNASYAKNDTITVVDYGTSKVGVTFNSETDGIIYIYGSDKQTAASLNLSKAEWNGVKYSTSSKFAVSKAEDYGKAYQVTGAKLNYLGRTWDITNLYLKFIKVENYTIVTNFSDKLTIASGSATELKIVYDRTIGTSTNAEDTKANGWCIKNRSGKVMDPYGNVYNLNAGKMGYAAAFTVKSSNTNLIQASRKGDWSATTVNWDEEYGYITIQPTGTIIPNDTDVTVTITYMNGADTVTKDIVVTVKGMN